MTLLGKQIKIQLIKQGMTQQELANLLHTTKQNLNGVLCGRSSSLALEEKLKEWLKGTRYGKSIN